MSEKIHIELVPGGLCKSYASLCDLLRKAAGSNNISDSEIDEVMDDLCSHLGVAPSNREAMNRLVGVSNDVIEQLLLVAVVHSCLAGSIKLTLEKDDSFSGVLH